MAESRSVRVILSAQIADFVAKMNQAKGAADSFASKLEANRAGADTLANGLLTVGTVAAVGLGFAVKASADFEQAMSNVKATGSDAATNFDALRDAAMDMGATTVFSATEAASGVENLMKAGISAKDVLGGGLKGSLDLAAAGSMDVGAAAEIAATALTQFGLSGAQVPHVADLLAAGAGKAQGEVADLGMALKQSGLVASQFGLSIEETVGGLSAFASAGLLGSDAGTSLKTMLQRMAAPSKEAAALMSQLGIAAYDTSGEFVGLEGLAGQLQGALTNLTPAQRDAAMATIFGADAVRAANVLYKEGASGIADWTAKVNDQGFAAEVAATKLDNLKGDAEALGGALETVLIKGGTGANEVLRGLTQGATDAVNTLGKLPAPVLNVGAGLLALVAAGGLAGGGLLKAVIAANDARTAFQSLTTAFPTLSGKLKGLGAVAGVATGALIALAAVQWAGSQYQAGVDKTRLSIEQMAQAAGQAAKGNMRALDTEFGNIWGAATDAGLALATVTNSTDKAGNAFAGFAEFMTGTKTNLTESREALTKFDQALVSLKPETAAAAFNELADSSSRYGKSTVDVMGQLPAYRDALLAQASALGVTNLSAQELAAWMGGQVPVGIQAAAAAADGANPAIAALAAGMSDASANAAAMASAMLQLSGSEMGLEAAFDAATAAIKENGQTAIDHGTALDIDTEKGRANKEALDGIAGAAIMLGQSQLEAGASAATMAASQADAATSFVGTAMSMGLTAAAAAQLAADYGLIPQSVATQISAPGADLSKQQILDFVGASAAVPGGVQTEVLAPGARPSKAEVDAFIASVGNVPGLTEAQIRTIADLAGVNAAKAAIASVQSKSVTITTVYSNIYTSTGNQKAVADGGLFAGVDMVQTYADGGMHKPAIGSQPPQIRAAGGRGILWAEEGAGPWEGFVSGHPAKRSRSRVITEEIARRLGGDVQWQQAFADGGFTAGSSRASTPMSGTPSREFVRELAAMLDARPVVSQVVIDGRVVAESGRQHNRGLR